MITEKAKDYLKGLTQKNRMGGSLLFTGASTTLMADVATNFAKDVIKSSKVQHPDIHNYKVEGKLGMHSSASIHDLIREVYLPPHESSHKFFIVHDAEKMLPTSANLILKTLEEPAPHTTIILLSTSHRELLPTILSRCQKVNFSDELEVFKKNEKIVQFLSKGFNQNYIEILKVSKELGGQLDECKKLIEKESAEKVLGKGKMKDLTASQQELVQKEIDGMVAKQMESEERAIFTTLLSWFRDLHLIKSLGNENLLLNKEYQAVLKEQAQSNFPALLTVQKIIDTARLSLDRSIPFQSVFETILLKFNCV